MELLVTFVLGFNEYHLKIPLIIMKSILYTLMLILNQ